MNSATTTWLGKALAVLFGAAALLVGVMFSMLALTVLLVVGAVIFAVLVWKTRHLRRHLRQQMASPNDWPEPAWRDNRDAGTIIEGEAVRQPAEEQRPRLGEPSPQARARNQED
ncbi:MAG TPA: hypothetical protein PLS39_05750 [Accumulibacter sp.]|nr:hypothetical protein [Accumulibacter sp.]HMY05696.1 hypothetical protein [Accumulibacter sp.]HND79922.1 hypothetical protein [Accumulibacter sp.]HNH24748.1 hypothetical protein [Accumulibacter sp.]HNO57182.1 hypothetical protein [Accumulibacter sp.]